MVPYQLIASTTPEMATSAPRIVYNKRLEPSGVAFVNGDPELPPEENDIARSPHEILLMHSCARVFWPDIMPERRIRTRYWTKTHQVVAWVKLGIDLRVK